MRLRAVWLTVLCTAIGSLPGGALAQEGEADQTTARLHFQTGASYYDTGNYADALREFQRSYELSGRVELFHNYSRCYEHLGDFANAALYLRRYLQEVSDLSNRPVLEIRLRNLEARASATSASPPTAPPPEERTGGTETAPAASGGGELPIGPIVAYAIGGASVVAAAIFGGLTVGEHSALQSGCGATRSCTEGDTSTMRTFALVTDISIGLAVAGAAVGTILLFVMGTGSGDQAPSAVLAPFATPDGAGIVFGGSL